MTTDQDRLLRAAEVVDGLQQKLYDTGLAHDRDGSLYAVLEYCHSYITILIGDYVVYDEENDPDDLLLCDSCWTAFMFQIEPIAQFVERGKTNRLPPPNEDDR